MTLESLNNFTADLKRALEEASLGHHFCVFKKHEVDLQLFITMNDKDLAEMGVLDSSDRAQLLALITKLTSQQKGTANGSSGGVARPGRHWSTCLCGFKSCFPNDIELYKDCYRHVISLSLSLSFFLLHTPTHTNSSLCIPITFTV